MVAPRLLLLLLLLNTLFGSLFYWAERSLQAELSWFDALWWAVVTMTTVGYGDISPLSWQGRFLVAYPAMFVGIGIVSYIIGSLTAGVMSFRQRQKMGMLTMKLKNHIVICNQPSVRKIANIIIEIRREYARLPIVILGDNWNELPEELKQLHVHFVHADPSRKSGLEQAAVADAHAVFILPRQLDNPQSDHSSFITASLIQSLNLERSKAQQKIRCLVELVLPENQAFIQEARPDKIFVPQVFNEKPDGTRVAQARHCRASQQLGLHRRRPTLYRRTTASWLEPERHLYATVCPRFEHTTLWHLQGQRRVLT